MNVGCSIGPVLDLDVNPTGNVWCARFVRMKVLQDIRKPLLPGYYQQRVDAEPCWVHFKYEKISEFCYYCGKLGHTRAGCSFQPVLTDPNFRFGPRMKAEAILHRKSAGDSSFPETSPPRPSSHSPPFPNPFPSSSQLFSSPLLSSSLPISSSLEIIQLPVNPPSSRLLEHSWSPLHDTVADIDEARDFFMWSDNDTANLQSASNMGIDSFHAFKICDDVESVLSPGVRKNQPSDAIRALFSEESNQLNSCPGLQSSQVSEKCLPHDSSPVSHAMTLTSDVARGPSSCLDLSRPLTLEVQSKVQFSAKPILSPTSCNPPPIKEKHFFLSRTTASPSLSTHDNSPSSPPSIRHRSKSKLTIEEEDVPIAALKIRNKSYGTQFRP